MSKRKRKKKFVQNDNNLAISYARVSSTSQNELSIEAQLEKCRRLAAEKGLEIVKEYSDYGFSGTTPDRPDFRKMLVEVELIKPAYCIICAPDRLARNVQVALLGRDTLLKYGCLPIYIEADVDLSTPEGRFTNTILDGVAELFADQNAFKVEFHMDLNAEKCRSNGSKKFGYRTNAEGYYEIYEPEAEIVREIFMRYDQGEGFSAIAEDLNARGYRTMADKLWRNDSCNKIVRNDTYKGVYRWGKHVKEGGMPVIIDETLFERCQKRLAANKYHKRKEGIETSYWLVPKLRCGECGSVMSGAFGKSSSSGHKKYYYYRCQNPDCSVKHVSKEAVEDTVENVMRVILSDRNNITMLAVDAYLEYQHKKQTEGLVIEELKRKLRDVNSKLDNLISAIEQGIFTDSTKQKIEEREEEKKALELSIATEEAKQRLCENEETITKYFNQYADGIDYENLDELKDLFEYFILELRLFADDYIVALCRYSTGLQFVEFHDWEEFVSYPASLVGVTDEESAFDPPDT